MTTSTKEALWLGCKEKTCCSSYTVFPTGLDIWRIATTLRVPPWAFTTLVPAEEGAPDGLVLDRSGQHFRVALAKVPAEGEKLSPCVFLMHFPDGTARCGLGNLRPSPCHSFPSRLIDKVLYLVNDGGCTCRKWLLSEVDIEEETAVVMAEKHAREAYYKVVANWNEYVRRATGDEGFSYPDFCRYLLDIYTTFDNRPKELARDGRN
jgi:Fe-S-cluster containining protein